ncbi:hypothetical protein HBH97_252170, partial [Parastagonospora nodorum]
MFTNSAGLLAPGQILAQPPPRSCPAALTSHLPTTSAVVNRLAHMPTRLRRRPSL